MFTFQKGKRKNGAELPSRQSYWTQQHSSVQIAFGTPPPQNKILGFVEKLKIRKGYLGSRGALFCVKEK